MKMFVVRISSKSKSHTREWRFLGADAHRCIHQTRTVLEEFLCRGCILPLLDTLFTSFAGCR